MAQTFIFTYSSKKINIKVCAASKMCLKRDSIKASDFRTNAKGEFCELKLSVITYLNYSVQ